MLPKKPFKAGSTMCALCSFFRRKSSAMLIFLFLARRRGLQSAVAAWHQVGYEEIERVSWRVVKQFFLAGRPQRQTEGSCCACIASVDWLDSPDEELFVDSKPRLQTSQWIQITWVGTTSVPFFRRQTLIQIFGLDGVSIEHRNHFSTCPLLETADGSCDLRHCDSFFMYNVRSSEVMKGLFLCCSFQYWSSLTRTVLRSLYALEGNS